MSTTICMKPRATLLVGALLLALTGCQTSSPILGGGDVSYGDTEAVEMVTTDLGSTDIKMISEEMTQSMISHPVVQNLIRTRGLMMASPVKNKTSEYFDTQLITDTILNQLQRNGVRYVIGAEGMQNQVDELRRQNQSGLYDKSRSVKMGKMHGAQYRIDGSVSSIVKRAGGIKDVYYKINMRLIDIETGIVEWSDEKDIRKTARR